jgi:hypothetical protein
MNKAVQSGFVVVAAVGFYLGLPVLMIWGWEPIVHRVVRASSRLWYELVHLNRWVYGIVLLVPLCGCSGGGNNSSGSPPPPPTITSVVLSPASTNVQPRETQQFSATVSGTGDFSSAVSWSVTGTVDGSPGTISSTGLYAAPATACNPNTVTVVAASTADPTKTASASVVIGSSPFQITGITLTPNPATAVIFQTLQFTATVQGTGSFNSAVQWSIDGTAGGDSTVGTISNTGLYTAPQTTPPGGTVNVQAASLVDNSVSATAQLTITQGPLITQLSPATANASDAILVLGQNLFAIGSTTTIFFPGPNGVPLPVLADPSSASPMQLPIHVPLAAVSGSVYVQTQAQGGSPATSNSVAFTRLPRVRIRAAQKDLSGGESVTFQSRIFGTAASEPLTWSADSGTVASDGTYTAPAGLTSDSFAVITACVLGTQICDQERLGLHPFRIAPLVPLVANGGTLQLHAIQGNSSIAPTWHLNGPGSLSPGGLYTASSQLADGGGVYVTATYNGVSETASVGVTGDFPGIVNRVSDYFDLNQYPFPLGTWAASVGVAANTAYVVSTNAIDFVTDNNYYWMDVYDITNPVNPIWIDAVEPAIRPTSTAYCDGFFYQIAYQDFSQGLPYPADIAVYDVSGSSPALISKGIFPLVLFSQYGCLLTQVSIGTPMIADLFQLTNGGVIHSQYTLPVSNPTASSAVAISDGSRIYVKLPQEQQDLIVYDLTVQPPAQVGIVDTGDLLASELSIAGSSLFLTPPLGFQILTHVYDISNAQPVFVGDMSTGTAIRSSGTTALAGTYDSGLRMLDLSQPQQPVVTANVFDFVDAMYTADLAGTYILSSEGFGGFAVYDVSVPGGLVPTYLNSSSESVAGYTALAQISNASTAFFAISTTNGDAGVLNFDLSTQPATFVGSFSTGASPAQALALVGSDLYVGTVDSLLVLDVGNPGAPSQIGSVNTGIVSLATAGNTLFAGTMDNTLVIYDITQGSNPVQQASVNLPAPAFELTVSGALLFVADGASGLLVYNVANPSAPVLLSQLVPSQAVYDVAVDGNLALLAAYDAGLVIVDCSNPLQLTVVGQAALDSVDPYATAEYPQNKAVTIALLDKIAFLGVDNINDPVTSGQAMIYGFDYTLSANPRLVQLGAYSNFLNDAVLSLRSNGTQLFAGLGLSLVEFSATQPRNTISLGFLPFALRTPYETGTPSSASRAGRQKVSQRGGQGGYHRNPGPRLPLEPKYVR